MEIYQINDHTDSYFTPHPKLFDLPSKLLVIGKSLLSGKSSLVINLLARPEFYKDLIKPEHIYIVSPTLHQEKWQKLINYLGIPPENLYNSYDPTEIQDLYDMVKEDFEEMKAAGERPPQRVVIFDDLGFSGIFSSSKAHNEDNVIDSIVLNGRHVLFSIWVIAQKYTQLSKTIRENATALVIYEASNSQWEQVADDHAKTKKKIFIEAAMEATKEPHNFMFINYSKPHRFYHNFTEPILNHKIPLPKQFQKEKEKEKESN
jgi:hypothetical protein